MEPRLQAWVRERQARIEAALPTLFDDAWPAPFQRACRYPLATGGKRLRPLLTLAAAEALGGELDAASLGTGLALELVHTYSLVHDDLPAMDDDDLRRGQPTVHRAFGEASAILVGDALLTEAFHLLATLPLPPETVVRLVAELARAAGHRGMVGGQAADIGLGGPVRDLEALQRVHRGKTGALIQAAVRMGGLVVRASPADLGALDRYGAAIGLAFQLADDLLDQDEAAREDGPPSYVRLLGAEETRRRARALAEEAREAVAGLPDPAILLALASYAVDRDH